MLYSTRDRTILVFLDSPNFTKLPEFVVVKEVLPIIVTSILCFDWLAYSLHGSRNQYELLAVVRTVVPICFAKIAVFVCLRETT